jgi:iron complex outermembrane receptor protein
MSCKIFFAGFFLMSLLLVSIFSFSQNKINGTVTDENGNGLEKATVQLKGTSTSVITDARGRYVLSNEMNFPWTIVVS